MDSVLEELKIKIIEFIEREELEVFDIKMFYFQKQLSVKILVDYRHGGISLKECSDLNRRLGEYIEDNNLLDQSYVLEVSSPGVKREFNQERDFVRIKGKDVNVWLDEPVEEKYHYEGKVKDINDKKVLISDKEKEVYIPINIIRKAKQKIN